MLEFGVDVELRAAVGLRWRRLFQRDAAFGWARARAGALACPDVFFGGPFRSQ